MATAGHGIAVITRTLNREKVPAIGRAKHWAMSYVTKLLTTRAVIGEFQPHRGHVGPDRKPDGPPIPNYFPAIITERQWHAARAGLAQRTQKRGRIGKRVAIFSGLLKDARDGGSMHQTHKGKKSGGVLLAPYNAAQGIPGTVKVSFPAVPFETAILSRLREIDPRDVLPRDDGLGARVMALSGKRADLEGRVERLKAALRTGGDVEAVIDVLRQLEDELRIVTVDLDAAQREAATPAAAAWGELKSLADVLASAPDQTDARTRLRSAIRRVVSEVRCLFVACGSQAKRKRSEATVGRKRLAAVQVRFAGSNDARRDYLIVHHPAHRGFQGRTEGHTEVESFNDAGIPSEYDFKKARDVKALEKRLAGLDLSSAAAGK
jgi:hypothetical protein